MKKLFIKAVLYFCLFPLFSEVYFDSGMYFTNLLHMNLMTADNKIGYSKNGYGIEADFDFFYLTNFDLKDFTDITFKFDDVRLLDGKIAPYYEHNGFLIKPSFSYSKLDTSSGDISVIEGKIQIPYVFTYGLEIGYKEHCLKLGASNLNGVYSTKQKDDTFSELLNTNQFACISSYAFNYKNDAISSKSSIDYLYVSGEFDCEMTDDNGPVLNPFERFKFTGTDSLHVLGMSEELIYRKYIFDFLLNLGNYFILNESAPYNLSWNGKTDLISKIALKALKLEKTCDKSGAYDELSGQGLFTAQIGFEMNCSSKPDFILHFSKYFVIPYEIENFNIASLKISKNEENLKWLKAGFTLGIRLKF